MTINAPVIVGFIVLGLSPSFMDWQQSPDRHAEFVAYYAIAIGLIVYGSSR